MAAIKVHGNLLSTASQRVFLCLHEKEVEFEFVPVDMRKKAQKQEPFISLNPFGQVPAFEHGDLTLFESRAIVQYIAHEFQDKGTQLICPGSKNMVTLSMWMEVEAHQFDPVACKLVWELFLCPLFGNPIDTAVVEENEVKLGTVLDIYETRLSQSKYLVGESFTLVDMHHIPRVQVLLGTQVKKLFDSRPHVSAWAADITARPAWSKVLAMIKQ